MLQIALQLIELKEHKKAIQKALYARQVALELQKLHNYKGLHLAKG